ncbi:MauE/DoxX family redox-associated membrane protein [Micromonospora zamorensis]|uniref:MauE/DoxX family redox-associated membrane protein n=1 Tax=Micromonospora zamorensis TaxID=709883 RepID=UPI0037B7597F
MRYLEVACRLLLVTVFVVAVYTKVSGMPAWLSFVDSLRQLDPVSTNVARPAAILTVTVEVLVTLLLLVPVRRVGEIGFVLAAGLLVAFTIVIALAVAKGTRATCRCFGASTTPLGWPHILRNLTLLVVALLGLAGASAPESLGVSGALLAGVGGLVLGVLVTVIEDIVALIRPIGQPRRQ